MICVFSKKHFVLKRLPAKDENKQTKKIRTFNISYKSRTVLSTLYILFYLGKIVLEPIL